MIEITVKGKSTDDIAAAVDQLYNLINSTTAAKRPTKPPQPSEDKEHTHAKTEKREYTLRDIHQRLPADDIENTAISVRDGYYVVSKGGRIDDWGSWIGALRDMRERYDSNTQEHYIPME